MMNSMRSRLLGVLACGLTLLVGASVYAQSLQEVMQQRGLTENDLLGLEGLQIDHRNPGIGLVVDEQVLPIIIPPGF